MKPPISDMGGQGMFDNTPMSDLHTRIADLLEDHSDWIYRCNCGHEGGYAEHVAGVLIKEVLTPEFLADLVITAVQKAANDE